jgi:hypothetical protein
MRWARAIRSSSAGCAAIFGADKREPREARGSSSSKPKSAKARRTNRLWDWSNNEDTPLLRLGQRDGAVFLAMAQE